jgi:hypothetical protein
LQGIFVFFPYRFAYVIESYACFEVDDVGDLHEDISTFCVDDPFLSYSFQRDAEDASDQTVVEYLQLA